MFFAKKYDMEIVEVGSKQSLEAVTDYPIADIDFKRIEEYEKNRKAGIDDEYPTFPLRKVRVISYDRNKYCRIEYKGTLSSIKLGYCYVPGLPPVASKWDDTPSYVRIGHGIACTLPHLCWKD